MPLYGRNRNRIPTSVIQALASPIRLRILELHIRDPTQPLRASTFLPDLAREFAGVSLRQVNYHLTQLQKVELLPARANQGTE